MRRKSVSRGILPAKQKVKRAILYLQGTANFRDAMLGGPDQESSDRGRYDLAGYADGHCLGTLN
jgi:hypothetical protein